MVKVPPQMAVNRNGTEIDGDVRGSVSRFLQPLHQEVTKPPQLNRRYRFQRLNLAATTSCFHFESDDCTPTGIETDNIDLPFASSPVGGQHINTGSAKMARGKRFSPCA